ncbi:MAG: hypothetical protein U1D67_05020, partial [Dehalococcoidia bacterium]|nr:hypothetical protein [Dehalococcoidia bacterium]
MKNIIKAGKVNKTMAMFPTGRMRRLRQTANLRKMLRETMPSVDDFVFPVFVVPGKGIKKEISSMPGCFHHSVDTLTEELKEVASLGIRAA